MIIIVFNQVMKSTLIYFCLEGRYNCEFLDAFLILNSGNLLELFHFMLLVKTAA
jgi:hypothetical protein